MEQSVAQTFSEYEKAMTVQHRTRFVGEAILRECEQNIAWKKREGEKRKLKTREVGGGFRITGTLLLPGKKAISISCDTRKVEDFLELEDKY